MSLDRIQVNDGALFDTYDNTLRSLYALTARERLLLQSVILQSGWNARWINQSMNADELEAWVMDIHNRLDVEETAMLDCNEVANCIGTQGSPTQQAINTYLQNTAQNGGVGSVTNIVNQTILSQSMTPPEMSCTSGHKFGMAMTIVQSIHDATIEVFQAIELESNVLELATLVSSFIPVIELAGKGAAVINWIQETAYEIYKAAYSTSVQQDIACQIFCLLESRGECDLSFDDIWDIWTQELFGFPADDAGIAAWIEWLIELVVILDIEIVKAGQLMGLIVMRYGGKFAQFELGINSMKTVVELASNDYDEDWQFLCINCVEGWVQHWNFVTHGQDTWVLELFNGDGIGGEFVPGVGLVGSEWRIGGNENLGVFLLVFDENRPLPSLREVTVHYDAVEGDNSDSTINGGYLTIVGEGGIGWSVKSLFEDDNHHLRAQVDTENADVRVQFWVRSSYANSSPVAGGITVTGITFRGDGIDPFNGRITS